MRRRSRRIAAWILAAGAALVLLLNVANLPFYSGSTIGTQFAWRMEHGRLKLERHTTRHHESFYIAVNSEGLRWAPDGRFYALNKWFITIPLWMPFVLLAGSAAALFLLRRHPPHGCRECGYDLRGLAAGSACPECGRRGPATPPSSGRSPP